MCIRDSSCVYSVDMSIWWGSENTFETRGCECFYSKDHPGYVWQIPNSMSPSDSVKLTEKTTADGVRLATPFSMTTIL